MKNHPSGKWETLAAGISLETRPVEESAPFGFATRVVARWREQQREAALNRWSLWSLRAALCSATACIVLVVLSQPEDAQEILFQTPAADFVTPPLSTP